MAEKKGFPIVLLPILVIAFLVLSCGNGTDQNKDGEMGKKRLEKLKETYQEKGEIVVGTSPDYPPFEFYLLDGDTTSDLVGLDIDIASEIAGRLDVKLSLQVYPFHQLFEILGEGEVDFVIAGINPSEKRKELVDFSDIYYQAVQNLLIRSEDRKVITGLVDLRGKTVGLQTGTIQENLAQKMVVGADFISHESIRELVRMLKEKEIDALVVEKPVADAYVARVGGILSLDCEVDAFDKQIGCAVAVRKGNDDLLAFINQVLDDLEEENKIAEFYENAALLNVKSQELEESLGESEL